MKAPTILLIALILPLAAAAPAQEAVQGESVFSDYLNVREPAGFLRIPGLDFSSSMGFSYFSSNGYGSGGFGYYLGHFNLKLSESLTLRADIGVGSMVTGPYADQQPEFFVPNIDITYRPSDSFMMRLQFNQYRVPTGLHWRRRR
jgi:hypothetical protein